LGRVNCLRVSEVNEYARQALSERFGPHLWVVGEIHGLKGHNKSGHVYFDLVEKDTSGKDGYIARIACAFFQGSIAAWRRSLKAAGLDRFELAHGMEVKLKARVDLFVREGRYQLVVIEVDPAYTLGAIAKMRARTIEQLRAMGLFERNKSIALSTLPLNVGLITSVGSAAFQDFTSILAGSRFSFRIFVFDAHTQGERTPVEIVQGIRALGAVGGLDVIVIVRGGGARTDLLAFDGMEVCRAIAACPVPVLTGIGHEIDLSVADMVAHRSFVTPTDAARFLVSRLEEAWSFLEEAASTLSRAFRRTIESASRSLEIVRTRLALVTRSCTSRPARAVESAASDFAARAYSLLSRRRAGLQALCTSLAHTTRSCIRGHEVRLDTSALSLRHHAESIVERAGREAAHTIDSSLRALSRGLHSHLGMLGLIERSLALMEPGRTLQRGFSITMGGDGRPCRDSRQVPQGGRIMTILARGRLHSTVFAREPGEDEDEEKDQGLC